MLTGTCLENDGDIEPMERHLRPGVGSLPRRILMTTDSVGGVWQYALTLARGHARAGVETVLAVLGPPPDDAQLAAAEAIPGVVVCGHEGRLEWMDQPWRDVDRAGAWLAELARRCEVELVHLNGYSYATAQFEVPVLVVAHSCLASWWRAVKGEQAPARYDDYRARVQAGIAAADWLVAPTQAMLNAVREHYGLLGQVEVIRNGIDARAIGAVKAASITSLPRKVPAILSAGRLFDEAKNVAALARISSRIEWPIKVAGALPDSGGGTGLDSGLHGLLPLGRLPPRAMAAQYASASIYASPALYEPFGLSVLEAAQAGCALVLGDIPSLRELWDEAAVFVNPRDDEALRTALTRLIDDPTERAALATRARQKAKRYPARAMIEGYLDLYRRLHTASRAGAAGGGGRALRCVS